MSLKHCVRSQITRLKLQKSFCLQIYEYFMVAINSTIFIMMQHALSDKMIFAILDV